MLFFTRTLTQLLTFQQHLTKSQVLEMAYQETLRSADMIVKDESARRLRLRILLLENENDELHEQLALADDKIDGLEQEGDELRSNLEVTQEDSNQHENELRNLTRELKNLKVFQTVASSIALTNSSRPS